MIIEKLNEELLLNDSGSRNYLGCSIIGSECERQVYYEYIGVSRETSSRSAMTFEIGKSLESLLLNLMDDAGIVILNSKENECKSKKIEKFKGHCDGVVHIDNRFYILEIKTACNSSFNRLIKKGVVQWMPKYYDQVQCYMGMKEIDSCIFVVINKDTSELYEEIIVLDPILYEILEQKAQKIISLDSPPPRISDNPMYFYCYSCAYKKLCHAKS